MAAMCVPVVSWKLWGMICDISSFIFFVSKTLFFPKFKLALIPLKCT